MPNQDFNNLGDEIKGIVQSAIDSQDFKELSSSLQKTVNSALNNVNDSLKKTAQNYTQNTQKPYSTYRADGAQNPWQSGSYRYNQKQRSQVTDIKKQSPKLYGATTGMSVGSGLLAGFGWVFTGSLGIGSLVLLIVAAAGVGFLPGINISLGIMLPLLAGSSVMTYAGMKGIGRLSRFRKYIKTLGGRTYCSIKELAASVRKNEKFVIKDLNKMIDKRMFPQGHIDQKGTCLMIEDGVYQQYLQTEEQLRLRQTEQQRLEERKSESEKKMTPEVKKIIDEGEDYLSQIKESNKAIPGEAVSAKISKMEVVVEKILDRVSGHPELIGDLRRFMDYYLPTTVKLLKAYEELDKQPVQGENIVSSKKEIENSLDTINVAFENLLDGFFKDTAWDISSDISAMQTMMAQEGLTGSDFAK